MYEFCKDQKSIHFRKSDDVYDSEMIEFQKMPFAQSLILNPKDKEKGNIIQLFRCDWDCRLKLKVYEDYLQNRTFGGSNPVFLRHIVDDVCLSTKNIFCVLFCQKKCLQFLVLGICTPFQPHKRTAFFQK